MKLFEYQAQNLLGEYQIPAAGGKIASSPDEAAEIAGKIKGKAVIKAQVLTGGRGKAGGIKVVNSKEEAKLAARQILQMKIKDNPVHQVLVTPAVEIDREIYASVLINSGGKEIECILCNEGGMEIEEIAANSPEKIYKIGIEPDFLSNSKLMMHELLPVFNFELAQAMIPIIKNLYQLLIEKDCSLVEINPLALLKNGHLMALDAKIVIDDNSLYKHPELEALKNKEEYSQDEIDAKKASLAFVSLDGKIGCMVNGAGLAMATMDLIKYFGGEPANFLDIGGSSNPQKVVDGLKILLRNNKIQAILLNIFGGITRCDDIAKGLIKAEKEFPIQLPLVIRLIGTNDKEGIDILQNNGFTAFSDLTEAVKAVVKAGGGKN